MAKPLRERKGWVWSTPSSMIPIFIPLPAVVSVRAPERGRADQRRGLVERLRRLAERVVAHGGIDPGDAGELREPGNLGARQLDRERVQDDAVVPAHVRGRERALDAALQRALRRGQAAEVANARRGAQVEPLGARGLRQHAAFGGRLRQRRRRRARRRPRFEARPRRQVRQAQAPPARREEQDPVSGRKWYRRYTCIAARMWRNW